MFQHETRTHRNTRCRELFTLTFLSQNARMLAGLYVARVQYSRLSQLAQHSAYTSYEVCTTESKIFGSRECPLQRQVAMAGLRRKTRTIVPDLGGAIV